jgi:DNA-directed RNA polymerase beta subunit
MADTKKRNQHIVTRQNVLESLKDLGTGTSVQAKDFIKDTSEDFIRELLGLTPAKVKRSGELNVGQTVQMGDILSGREEQIGEVKRQATFERRILNEERKTSQEKSESLRLELQAIMQEVQKVGASMENLGEATSASIISAPVEPGIYHISFFESILEFLQSFRKRIDLATTWLTSTNKRAEKKNYWSTYKKKGSSFLLSPDHYLSRSAG